MKSLSTRIASIADVDVVSRLFDAYRQFYDQAPNLSLARNFIEERIRNHESLILLAITSEHVPVGFCQLYPSFCSVEAKPIYSLYDLFVVPEARRYGAGRLLLLAAESLARQNGKARMDLTTAKSNKPAQSVYESLGWVRDEIFYAYSRHIAA